MASFEAVEAPTHETVRARVRRLAAEIPSVELHLRTVADLRNSANSKSEKDELDQLVRVLETHLEFAKTTNCMLAGYIMQADLDAATLPIQEMQQMHDILDEFIDFCRTCTIHSNQFQRFGRQLWRICQTHPWFVAASATAGGVGGLIAGAATLHVKVVACCGGGITAASKSALRLYTIGGVAVGVIGVLVLIGLYKAYKHFKTPAETRKAQELKAHIKMLSEGSARLDQSTLDQLRRDVTAFYAPLRGSHIATSECCVCLRDDMAACLHVGRSPAHVAACAVQPFQCRHLLCHECASNTRGVINSCPLCRAPAETR